MKSVTLKIYEVKVKTPMGVVSYQVEATSYVDANIVFMRDHPRYPIASIRMLFISELPKPFSPDDPLPERARPLRADLD